MHRYLAFAWDTRAVESNALVAVLRRRIRSELPDLKSVFSVAGMQVYRASMAESHVVAYLVGRDGGIVLGNLFGLNLPLETHENHVVIDRDTTHEILATAGRYLIDNCWGRYIAILRDPRRRCIRILRDPTGAMPCQLAYHHRIAVLWSQVADAAALGLVDETINWSHVTAYLMDPRRVTRETGLQSVQHVQAGECVTIDSTGENAKFYWHPVLVHDSRTVDDPRQAAKELRRTVQQCVTRWASCYSSILHSLSGGLDSSIVLACLAESSTSVTCQNYFTRHTQGDERRYAQIAAKSAGVHLVESLISVSGRSLEEMIDRRRVVSPEHGYLIADSELERERLVDLLDIQAVFSGQGGDHLFQQLRTPLVAADFVHRRGLRTGFATVIADTARLTREPIWTVLCVAFLYGALLKRRDGYSKSQASLLVADGAYDAFHSRAVHPWIADATHLPINKRRQIRSIIDTQNFFSEPARYTDIVHPLISQPIIELCLQIPSYVLTYAGVDRALARDAFSDFLPAQVVRRTDKGGTTGVFAELLIENLAFVRAYLLDGLLVGQGLLDRSKVESTVSEARILRDVYALFPIVHAILAESWTRNWTGHTATWSA